MSQELLSASLSKLVARLQIALGILFLSSAYVFRLLLIAPVFVLLAIILGYAWTWTFSNRARRALQEHFEGQSRYWRRELESKPARENQTEFAANVEKLEMISRSPAIPVVSESLFPMRYFNKLYQFEKLEDSLMKSDSRPPRTVHAQVTRFPTAIFAIAILSLGLLASVTVFLLTREINAHISSDLAA